MKNKIYSILYVVITIVLIALIILLALNFYNKKRFETEINKIMNEDINNYKYTDNTATFFEYKKVEQAIKEYMRDYADNIKKIDTIINDDTIKNILSISNLEKDGKEFNKSIKLIQEKQKELEDTVNILNTLNTKDKILEYIEKKEVNQKYKEIYEEYMLKEKNIKNNNNNIQTLKQKTEKILNIDLEILNLLKNNPDSWTISEGKIGFYSNDLIDKYNKLKDQLK